MAGSKKNKLVKQKQIPTEKSIAQSGNPEQYYAEYPAWSFSNSDSMMWAFSQEHIGNLIWEEIFPRIKSLETQTWSEILVKDGSV
ncbi:MAG: hypothetical protein LUG56_07095 [Lachnospiraceae bacterium]|nr:hypothetical protein [Lachnospiraceae bacterium]